MTAVTTMRSGPQRRVITEVIKDAGLAPLIQLFFIVLVTCMFSVPSPCGWIGLKWQIHSNIPNSMSLLIPSSALKQGRFGIFNSHCGLPLGSCFSQPTKQMVRALPSSRGAMLNVKCRIFAEWAHIIELSLIHDTTPSVFIPIQVPWIPIFIY